MNPDIDPLTKHVAGIMRSLDSKRVLQLQKNLLEMMPAIDLKTIAAHQRRLGDIVSNVFQNQTHFSGLMSSVTKNLRQIEQAQRRFDARFPGYLRVLAKNGWYISVWHTPLAEIPPLVALLNEGKVEEANRKLCKHFNELSGEIEVNLCKRFPARAIILKKAFEAHRRGDFELSVPVFLAQADGIMIETIAKKYSVYARHSKKVRTLEDLVKNIAQVRTQKDILEVALLQMPLNDSEAHKYSSGEILNRNAVHHGISTTYGNLVNSCRAISWLQYVAHFDEAKKFASRQSKP